MPNVPTDARTIEVVPAEIRDRLAALTTEAHALLPPAADLARRAWDALQDYSDALDPIFDRDQANEQSGADALWTAMLELGDNFGAVTDSFNSDEPGWLAEAKAARTPGLSVVQ